jgi:di/tripeptidase
MEIAKTEIADKRLFKKVKASINRMDYVECGLCGAIRVEAKELARVVNSFIDKSKNANEELNDFWSYFLMSITESAPLELESFEEFKKWEAADERPVYHFLDADDYSSETYGSYDEIVIFYDPTCDCFGKDKIKKQIDC